MSDMTYLQAPSGRKIVKVTTVSTHTYSVSAVHLDHRFGAAVGVRSSNGEDVSDSHIRYIDADGRTWAGKDLVPIPSSPPAPKDTGPKPEDLIPDRPYSWDIKDYGQPKIMGMTVEGFVAIWAGLPDYNRTTLILKWRGGSLWEAASYVRQTDGRYQLFSRSQDMAGLHPPSLGKLARYLRGTDGGPYKTDTVDHIPELRLFGADVAHATS